MKLEINNGVALPTWEVLTRPSQRIAGSAAALRCSVAPCLAASTCFAHRPRQDSPEACLWLQGRLDTREGILPAKDASGQTGERNWSRGIEDPDHKAIPLCLALGVRRRPSHDVMHRVQGRAHQ